MNLLHPRALACALILVVGALRDAHAGVDAIPFDSGTDPHAPAYIITSADIYKSDLQGIIGNGKGIGMRDSVGTSLVLAEVQSFQLDQISRAIHEKRNRCGGYFAFASRAEAEAFVRGDQSGKAVAAKLVSYTIDNQTTVNPWLPLVSESNIRSTITTLSANQNRYYTSPTGKTSAESIRNTWQGLAGSRSDVSTELFTCSNCSTQPSVILTINGNELPNEILVLGAHLDSINTSGGGSNTQIAPGADDDASGVATLTEVIRIALANGWKPKRTVKFMAYAAEEVGLRGSNAIAQSFKAAAKNVVGMMQFDMTNYKVGSVSDMQLITDYSNAEMKTFLTNLFDTYLAPSGLTRSTYTCGYGCSDHASWTSAGYPAAMMFEGGSSSGYNPNIHGPNDTLANMSGSAANSVKFAKLGLAFLGELGKTTGGGTPTGSVLTNDVAKTGLGAAAGTSLDFTMVVPSGATGLKFVSAGGSGDLDLYVKFGAAPTDSVYDCTSQGSSNAETCNIATAQAGTYYVRLKAYSTFASASLTGSYTTGTPPGPTQTYTNSTVFTVADNATVDSLITVSGRTGNAPTTATVSVNITHTYQGDLKVDLVAPDGSLYNLHNRTGSGTDNVIKTVTLNLSSELINGTWKMRVNDNAAGDTGKLNSWSVKM